MQIYFKSTRLKPFSPYNQEDPVDHEKNEFGLESYDLLGAELILNYKYLDAYRYPQSQAYLYHNLQQWNFE